MPQFSGARITFYCLGIGTVLLVMNMMSTRGGLDTLHLPHDDSDVSSNRAVQATLILSVLAYATGTALAAYRTFDKSSDRRSSVVPCLIMMSSIVGALLILIALSTYQHQYLQFLKDHKLKVSKMGLSDVPYNTAFYVITLFLGIVPFLVTCIERLSRSQDEYSQQAAAVTTTYPQGPQSGYPAVGQPEATGPKGSNPHIVVYTDDQGAVVPPPSPRGYQQPSPGPHRKGDGATGLAAGAPEYIPRYGEQPAN